MSALIPFMLNTVRRYSTDSLYTDSCLFLDVPAPKLTQKKLAKYKKLAKCKKAEYDGYGRNTSVNVNEKIVSGVHLQADYG